MAPSDPTLRVWRLHPSGCRIEQAERTLHGTANRGGVRFCGPFTNANRAGWWLFPPVDIDITWLGGTDFEHELLSPYDSVDRDLVRFLADEEDLEHVDRWSGAEGRTKFTWGLVEAGVVQIWTGCIFETPPDWALLIRSPVNFPPRACHVMEAVLETDWLHYDIWLNLVFDRAGETVSLRREGWPPIAQLVPVPRETYDARWGLAEETINRNSEAADRVFRYWVDYNRKKFAGDGRNPIGFSDPPALKDSSTYYKERKRLLKPTD
jgi:Family of unknown function (DUF6065)